MSKGQNTKKNSKKQAVKSMKEKKAEKRDKKNKKNNPGFITDQNKLAASPIIIERYSQPV